jgi:hypothetical protein
MAWGEKAVFNVSIASGARASDTVDLGRNWRFLWLEVPEGIQATNVNLQWLSTSDGTAANVRSSTYAAGSFNGYAISTFTIATTGSHCVLPLPGGTRYLQLNASAAVTNGQAYRILATG